MAIAVLVLWICTAAVGTYLLATATRMAGPESVPSEAEAAVAASPAAAPARRASRDPFAPPSLQRQRSEQLPLARSLAEFAHPALAMIGFGFWFGYVVSRDRLFLAIGLGILLGAIGAGLSWFTVNTRAVRRAAAAEAAGRPGVEDPRFAPQSFSRRVLTLHAVGAALTLLFAALIAARV